MKRFRDIGIKLTPQRLAILNYLAGNKSHPSAEDIYSEVKEMFPTMSLATVYNTIEALRRRGRVLEVTIEPTKKRFDPDTRPHHHLICVKCKKIRDIHYEYSLPVSAKERGGFEIIGNHIEFYGLCPLCKQEQVFES